MVGWRIGSKKKGYVFQNPRLDGWIADRIGKKRGHPFENPSWMDLFWSFSLAELETSETKANLAQLGLEQGLSLVPFG